MKTSVSNIKCKLLTREKKRISVTKSITCLSNMETVPPTTLSQGSDHLIALHCGDTNILLASSLLARDETF